MFFHWCWSYFTVTCTILHSHVNKYNTAAANVISCVIFPFKKSQSEFVCPSVLKKCNIINTYHKRSQTLFIFHVPGGRPAWDLKDKLHLCTAAPQLTLFPSLLQAANMKYCGKSFIQVLKKSHVFHPTQTSTPARLLLHTSNRATVPTSARNSLVLAQIPLCQRRWRE